MFTGLVSRLGRIWSRSGLTQFGRAARLITDTESHVAEDDNGNITSELEVKVSPVITVNGLMLIVVHSTAAATSLREEMVPVQRFPMRSAEAEVSARKAVAAATVLVLRSKREGGGA